MPFSTVIGQFAHCLRLIVFVTSERHKDRKSFFLS